MPCQPPPRIAGNRTPSLRLLWLRSNGEAAGVRASACSALTHPRKVLALRLRALPRLLPPMLKLDFAAAVDLIVEKNPKFDRDAYFFLREVLEHTASDSKKVREPRSRHVTGQELLEGVRKVALAQFGPMVPTVFDAWGIKRGEDFGEMVYSLIDAGFFRKSPQDSLEDFSGGYNFHDAFVVPFLPSSAVGRKSPRTRRRDAKTLQK